MYKKCNATINIWKKYEGQVKQTANNISLENCLQEVIDQAKLRKTRDCFCSRPCEEIVYSTTLFNNGAFLDGWELSFYLKDAATMIKLVPDYPLEAFMGSLGGVLGLGGKIMATLQLMIFLSLCIAYTRMR